MIKFFLMLESIVLYLIVTSFVLPGIAITRGKIHLAAAKLIGIAGIVVASWFFSHFISIPWWQIAYIIFVLLSLLGLPKLIKMITKPIKTEKKTLAEFVALEIIGLIIYTILNAIRTKRPDIMGTERPMDFSFMYNLMKQPNMPPENPWLTGTVLNYYYLGQFTMALLTKFSHVIPEVSYNLMISLWAVFIVNAGFYLSSVVFPKLNLAKRILIALLLTFGGNFYLIRNFWKGIKAMFDFYYPAATRVIPQTINEFPSYSVVLGDMHGHYLSFPFFLTAVGLLLLLYQNLVNLKRKSTITAISWLLLPLTILTFYVFASNSWDIIPLGELLFILMLLTIKNKSEILSRKNIIATIPYLVLLGALVGVFKYYFITPLNGIGIVGINSPITKAEDAKYYLILFGQFILAAIPTLTAQKYKRPKQLYVIGLIILALLLGQYWILILLLIVALLTLLNLKDNALKLSAILASLGFFNILLVSVVYLKDVFSTVNPPYARANTLFKIYYEAWGLLVIGTIGMLAYELSKKHPKIIKIFLTSTFIFINVVMGTYFIKATLDKFGEDAFEPKTYIHFITNPWGEKTLNGLTFLKRNSKHDYEILKRVRALTENTYPVTVVEAMTYQSYSYYGRIGFYSGNRLILGWPFHNVQWYNSNKDYVYYAYKYDLTSRKPIRERTKIVTSERLKELEAFYKKPENIDKLRDIINKYQVKFIVIGTQEYKAYPNLSRKTYDSLKKICPRVLYEKQEQDKIYALLACI